MGLSSGSMLRRNNITSMMSVRDRLARYFFEDEAADFLPDFEFGLWFDSNNKDPPGLAPSLSKLSLFRVGRNP